MPALLLLLLCALLSRPAAAWTADEPWRTVSTEHFDIHYPLRSEAWALDLAGRVDQMRARVASVVGWSPTRRTTLVLMDPLGRANGFAVPFSRGPFMGVFPAAPSPASGIGNYRLWAEDLVIHEDAHLLHMGRPSRSPLGHLVFDRLLGFAPIGVRSPGWVIEGYATLVEGVLTGAGRPHSDSRAAFLRALAREGQLPAYGELDGSSRWRGSAMRYLVGSAYLEWLAARAGPDALPGLWARMTARDLRSFDEAFLGVFGDTPAALYGRFVAETTAGALSVEASPGAAIRWLDLDGSVGAPAISPDGQWVALVEHEGGGPAALVVRETAIDTAARDARTADVEDTLARDPDDVAPVAPRAPPHVEAARRVHAGRVAAQPRWLDDGTVLFSAWTPGPRGDLRPDLYTWAVATGRERRLTRGANLREADPCGGQAVAVRRRDGGSALVVVALESGAVTPLTEPHPTRVEAGPRMLPGCGAVVFLRNDGAGWGLVHLDLASGDEQAVSLPADAQALSVAVRPGSGALVASLGRGGFVDLWERPADGGDWVRRTARPGGALTPAAAADGAVYFLSQDPRGMDLYRLPDDAAPVEDPPPGPVRDRAWTAGVVRPPPALDAPALPAGLAPTPRPYRLGAPQARALLGVQASSAPDGASAANLGLFVGDPVGRSELLLQGGLVPVSRGGVRPAGRVDWTWRRLPTHLRLHGWGHARWGGGADLLFARRWSGGGVELSGGGFAEAAPDAGLRAAAVVASRLWSSAFTGATAWTARLDARGMAGTAQLGHATAGARVGQPRWSVGAQVTAGGARAGALTGGSQHPSLLPELSTVDRVWRPGWGPVVGSAVGAARVEARVRGDAVGLFAERLGAGDRLAAAARDTDVTLVGFDLRVGSDAQPIAKIPGISGRVGVGCAVADGPGGWGECLGLAPWAGWVGLRLEPGRPPAGP